MDKALTTVGWGIPILIGAAVAIWARLEGIQWLQGAIFGAAGVLIVITIEDLVNQKRQRYGKSWDARAERLRPFMQRAI